MKYKVLIDLNTLWAKSDGEELIYHTNNVIENVNLLGNNYKISNSDLTTLKYAATLHDIGKVLIVFQKFVKTGKKSKFKFHHNVIGWYFINKYVNLPNKDKIANLVLWHHANNNSCADLPTKLLEISREISDSEIYTMKEFCKQYDIPIHNEESDEEINDTEFHRVDNLLRSMLITADVCASSKEDVLDLFNSPSIDIENATGKLKEFLESARTKYQLDVLTKIIIGYTTLIKAPTGFGKTILGILFAITQKKSVIWACPTNIISISIYDDVIKAIEMMGIDISVELYLAGGKIKKSNKGSDEFTSKIIITNIDSFTKPTVSNSFGHRCFMIYVCPVIFDEPHDYDKMNCALNSCFNNVMTTRHNYINSTTVLLTATPAHTRFLMQGGKQINVLPSAENHYPASHKQKIKIVFHKYTPWDKMKGEFVHFSHTVNDVRENYITYPSDKLIAHGRYLDSDKEIKKNLVLDNYGKGCIRRELGVFTNQILTTACDYSVSEIFIKCPTIREFFQALGRLNRFGDMGTCIIHIIEEKSQNDTIHIGGPEENELQEFFVKELKQNFSHKETDLDELYVFYNMFCEKHKVIMNAISRQNLTKSRSMIKHIFPKRYKEKLDESNDKAVANGNKMRQSPTASGMFILIQRIDSDEWITIDFNLNTNIGISNTFKEDKNTLKNQIKVLKKLDRYNKYKKITSEIMIRESIFYDTPYVVLNLKYCRDLGTVPI